MSAVAVAHSPEISLSQARGEPSINQLLTLADDETDPTFFDCLDADAFALSVQADNGGVLQAASDFVLQMLRSIDGGLSYQLMATYTAQQELFVPCAMRGVLWKWKLTTAGALPIRVRAKT